MKKIVIVLTVLCISQLAFNYHLSNEICKLKTAQLEQENYNVAIDNLVHALEYKRNAQMYFLCSDPTKERFKVVADSCEAYCAKQKEN